MKTYCGLSFFTYNGPFYCPLYMKIYRCSYAYLTKYVPGWKVFWTKVLEKNQTYIFSKSLNLSTQLNKLDVIHIFLNLCYLTITMISCSHQKITHGLSVFQLFMLLFLSVSMDIQKYTVYVFTFPTTVSYLLHFLSSSCSFRV